MQRRHSTAWSKPCIDPYLIITLSPTFQWNMIFTIFTPARGQVAVLWNNYVIPELWDLAHVKKKKQLKLYVYLLK